MNREDLDKLSREGKLQETLRELKRLSETWEKMADKHKIILADYASTRPEATKSVKAMFEKEKELANQFQRDITQIESYIAKKDRLK